MTVRSTAAFVELRALISAGQFTGTRVRRLIVRATQNYPDQNRLPSLTDMLNRYLAQAEEEMADGVALFSLPTVLAMIDEFEEAERTGEIPEACR